MIYNLHLHLNKSIFSQPTPGGCTVWQRDWDASVSSTALLSALIYVPGTQTLDSIQKVHTFLYGILLFDAKLASENTNEICYSQSVHQNVLPQLISSSIIHSAIIWQRSERE